MSDNPSFDKLDAAVEAIEADVANNRIPMPSSDTMSEEGSDIATNQTSDIALDLTSDIAPSPRSNFAKNKASDLDRMSDPTIDALSDSKIIDLSERLSQNRMSEADLERAETILEGLSSDIWREISEELNQAKPSLQNLHQNASEGSVVTKPSTGDSGRNSKAKQPIFNADSLAPGSEPEVPLAIRKQIEAFEAERDASKAKLEEIQKGIDAYWIKYSPKPNPTARALGAVLSLGFVVVAVLYASYWLGTMLVNHTGQGWLLPCCLVVGMLSGFYMGFILLAPVIKPRFDTAGNRISDDTPSFPQRQGSRNPIEPTKADTTTPAPPTAQPSDSAEPKS